MDSKNLFEQAKHDGFATIYNDTPNEVVEKIKAYNEDMGVCRVNRKRAEKCAMTFTLINPIAAAVFFLGSMIAADHIAITVVTTAVFLAVYFVFTIMKRNLLVVSCASALLLLVSYWSLLLLAAAARNPAKNRYHSRVPHEHRKRAENSRRLQRLQRYTAHIQREKDSRDRDRGEVILRLKIKPKKRKPTAAPT